MLSEECSLFVYLCISMCCHVIAAQYLDLWRDHSGSKDETGELPVSQLTSVVCSECNPKHELIDALTALKNDGKSE